MRFNVECPLFFKSWLMSLFIEARNKYCLCGVDVVKEGKESVYKLSSKFWRRKDWFHSGPCNVLLGLNLDDFGVCNGNTTISAWLYNWMNVMNERAVDLSCANNGLACEMCSFCPDLLAKIHEHLE